MAQIDAAFSYYGIFFVNLCLIVLAFLGFWLMTREVSAIRKDIGDIHSMLKSHVPGYNVTHAMSDVAVRANPPVAYYNVALPSLWRDPTVVVPGLPTPHNGL